jgi:HSP20 family protein
MLTLFNDFDRDFNPRLVDRLFRDFEARPRFEQAIGPRVDIVEREESFELTAEVAGYAPDDVEITVHEGVLTIAGKRETSTSLGEGAKVLHRERRSGAFSRTFKLGDAIDPEKIEATVKDGLLTVVLPKAAETRPRQIAIKTSQ